MTTNGTDDAFTLLRQAVDLLPGNATAENGLTIADVRRDIELQEWETVLDMLIEIADVRPVSTAFWEKLAEAARQMMLDRTRRWCQWRAWEVGHGTIRAGLTLLGTEESGRRNAFDGDGRLRPLWDIGHRTAAGEQDLNVARLWVEFAPRLGPGETADVRLEPLQVEQWRHLKPGDVIVMYETRTAGGIAEIIEVLPPHA
ncbi:hypothetical protein ACFYUY_08605 [Kitasatospora sp. NPDC004745]|uniref:hypothetical protein n=1 Tax=Kitasatospora sp. NPDC004745 TaxID=3364019 RepID=UPI003684D5F4